MKIKSILLVLLLGMSFAFFAQEKGTGPKERSFKSERKLRKEDRREAKEKRLKEKAERKAVEKHHKRLQTKTVQKRMKAGKRRARLNNENKREFFLRRWFQKKKKV